MNLVARLFGALMLGVALAHPPALAQTAQTAQSHDEVRWAGSWAAAPQDYAQPLPWVAAPTSPPPLLENQTLRQELQPTLGGRRVRVRFSNRFGKKPLHIASANVARNTGGHAVSPASLQSLQFGGHADITIAPGAEAWSDAASFAVAPDQTVSVSFYVDAPVPFATVHHLTPGATWISPGNRVREATLPDAARTDWNHIVTGLDVLGPRAARVVVAFGDSITEGAGIEGDGRMLRYPERLALRLRGRPGSAGQFSVLNEGISGNRLLSDGAGPKGIDRFRRDVLEQSGVTHVIILIGINDIGLTLPQGSSGRLGPPEIDQITAGLQRLIDESRAWGVKVLLGTLLPFKGSPYWTAEKELRRQAVNRWIRGQQGVDGVVDFDAALRDPADPQSLKPVYDLGDHLHPGVAGHAAMADAIDLRALQK
jgi:lysophospholipase L1-like esterase